MQCVRVMSAVRARDERMSAVHDEKRVSAVHDKSLLQAISHLSLQPGTL